jgi:hypothetical protein
MRTLIKGSVLIMSWLAFLGVAIFASGGYRDAAADSFAQPPPIPWFLVAGGLLNTLATISVFWCGKKGRYGLRQAQIMVIPLSLIFWVFIYAVLAFFIRDLIGRPTKTRSETETVRSSLGGHQLT